MGHLRNKLRFFWLWLADRVADVLSECEICGARGASVSSLLYPHKLCGTCGAWVCSNPPLVSKVRDLMEKGSRPLLIEEEDNIPCDDEVPCFDTFPGPAPTTCTRLAPHVCKVNGPCNGLPKPVGHPAANCSAIDGTRVVWVFYRC